MAADAYGSPHERVAVTVVALLLATVLSALLWSKIDALEPDDGGVPEHRMFVSTPSTDHRMIGVATRSLGTIGR